MKKVCIITLSIACLCSIISFYKLSSDETPETTYLIYMNDTVYLISAEDTITVMPKISDVEVYINVASDSVKN